MVHFDNDGCGVENLERGVSIAKYLLKEFQRLNISKESH